jgi:hypothetical protein
MLPNGGALWMDNVTGLKVRREGICADPEGRGPPLTWLVPRAASAHNEGMSATHLGDVEELCGALATPSPTRVEPTVTDPGRAFTYPSLSWSGALLSSGEWTWC